MKLRQQTLSPFFLYNRHISAPPGEARPLISVFCTLENQSKVIEGNMCFLIIMRHISVSVFLLFKPKDVRSQSTTKFLLNLCVFFHSSKSIFNGLCQCPCHDCDEQKSLCSINFLFIAASYAKTNGSVEIHSTAFSTVIPPAGIMGI